MIKRPVGPTTWDERDLYQDALWCMTWIQRVVWTIDNFVLGL